MTKWKLGHVDVKFSEMSFKSLGYFKEPFNDTATVKAWTDLYGEIFDTGWMVDHRSFQPEWALDVAEEIGLKNPGTSFYRMNPGTILPYHSDTYARYASYHEVDPHEVYRAVVFLQDWKPGHLFEIDGEPIYKYTAGTYVLWNYDTPHLAGNIGPDYRYSLQITGLLPNGIEQL